MHTRGFTLIELLVVIAIIGLLSSVVLSSLNSVRAKARDTRRLSDMTQIKSAILLYYHDNGTWPPEAISGNYPGDWSSNFKTALAPYMPIVPVDPVLNQHSGYPGWTGPAKYQFYGFIKCNTVTPDNNCKWLNSPQTGQFCPGKAVLYSYSTEGKVTHNECGSTYFNEFSFILGDYP